MSQILRSEGDDSAPGPCFNAGSLDLEFALDAIADESIGAFLRGDKSI